jgi:hypothetical protein
MSAAARQRLAVALANPHGLQQRPVASVPRGQAVDVSHLHLDACQVVDECSMSQARS